MPHHFPTQAENDMAAMIEDRGLGTVTGNGNCRSCGQAILWVKLPTTRSAPFDVTPYKDGGPINHFGTCPNAKQHRKEKA